MNKQVPTFVSLDEELPDPYLTESNSDGTISDGEKEQADELINGITSDVKVKIRKAAIKLHKLGGPFRAPSYLQSLMQGVNQAVQDAVKDEAIEAEAEKKDSKGKSDSKSKEKPEPKSKAKSKPESDDDDSGDEDTD